MLDPKEESYTFSYTFLALVNTGTYSFCMFMFWILLQNTDVNVNVLMFSGHTRGRRRLLAHRLNLLYSLDG